MSYFKQRNMKQSFKFLTDIDLALSVNGHGILWVEGGRKKGAFLPTIIKKTIEIMHVSSHAKS